MKTDFKTYLLSDLMNIPLTERLNLIENHICAHEQNMHEQMDAIYTHLNQSERSSFCNDSK